MTDDARTVCEAFVEFCDGIEVAGLKEYARRGRRVAALLFEALDQVDSERSCRRSVQERHELLLERLEQLHGREALGEVWP